jgi:hypothetical protein
MMLGSQCSPCCGPSCAGLFGAQSATISLAAQNTIYCQRYGDRASWPTVNDLLSTTFFRGQEIYHGSHVLDYAGEDSEKTYVHSPVLAEIEGADSGCVGGRITGEIYKTPSVLVTATVGSSKVPNSLLLARFVIPFVVTTHFFPPRSLPPGAGIGDCPMPTPTIICAPLVGFGYKSKVMALKGSTVSVVCLPPPFSNENAHIYPTQFFPDFTDQPTAVDFGVSFTPVFLQLIAASWWNFNSTLAPTITSVKVGT